MGLSSWSSNLNGWRRIWPRRIDRKWGNDRCISFLFFEFSPNYSTNFIGLEIKKKIFLQSETTVDRHFWASTDVLQQQKCWRLYQPRIPREGRLTFSQLVRSRRSFLQTSSRSRVVGSRAQLRAYVADVRFQGNPHFLRRIYFSCRKKNFFEKKNSISVPETQCFGTEKIHFPSRHGIPDENLFLWKKKIVRTKKTVNFYFSKFHKFSGIHDFSHNQTIRNS